MPAGTAIRLRPRQLQWLLRLFAVGLFFAAGYHLVAIFNGAPSVGRHALFVAINLVFACGFLRPWPGFAVLVAVLCVQQFLSHGGTLVRVLRTENRLDWPSVVVLITMPLALAVTVLDARRRRATSRTEV